MKEAYLFKPFKKGMIYEYPELGQIPEFACLTNKQLLFVWNYSNITSPHFFIRKKNEKLHKCIHDSFGRLADDEYARYMNEDFPQDIRDAMKRMDTFDVSARYRAKLNVEKVFSNLEKMIDIAEGQIQSMDLDEKKKYADFSIKVAEAMPGLIKQLEDGFGIRTEEAKEDNKKAPSLADKILSNIEIDD